MKDIDGSTALHCVADIITSKIAELERVLQNADAAPQKRPARIRLLAKLRARQRLLRLRAKDSSHPGRPELGKIPLDQLGAICAIASGVMGLWKELREVAVPTVLDIMDIFAETS